MYRSVYRSKLENNVYCVILSILITSRGGKIVGSGMSDNGSMRVVYSTSESGLIQAPNTFLFIVELCKLFTR